MSLCLLVGVVSVFTLLRFVACDYCEVSDSDTCYCSCCQGLGCGVECVGEFAVADCSDCTASACAADYTECAKSSNRVVEASCSTSRGNETLYFIVFIVVGLVLVCGGFGVYKYRQRKQQQQQQDPDQLPLSSPPEADDYQNTIQQPSYQTSSFSPYNNETEQCGACGISVGGWIRFLILYGVMVGFVIMTMGVAGNILATGPTWSQRAVEGITGQNSYCFSKDILATYGYLLMIPSCVQLGVGVLGSCCLGSCCPLGALFTMSGLLAAVVAFAESAFFVDLANEGKVLTHTECPFDLKGGSVRVDGFFLTPMAVTLIVLCSLYVLVGVRSMWKQRKSSQQRNY